MSKWTRLCEIDIPSAVEEHLKTPTSLQKRPPPSILALERRLGEPVKVHNDDKIRRQKLKEQRRSEKSSDGERSPLELRAALAKLSVDSVPSSATRENSEIRKVKTTELPPLEHVFAEGLYFTLTDVVLLPCIYLYLVRAHFTLLPTHDLILTNGHQFSIDPIIIAFQLISENSTPQKCMFLFKVLIQRTSIPHHSTAMEHAAHTRLLSYPSRQKFSNKKTCQIRAGTGFTVAEAPEPPGEER